MMKLRTLIHLAAAALLAATATLATLPARAQSANTLVRVHTTHGPIDMTLLNAEAPVTVANFLAYVRGGDYANVLFHRSAWLTGPTPAPFVIQAGGFVWPEGGDCCTAVPSRGTIVNEFSPSRSNIRGTVAMAKVANNPNSATSQWFINMGDNAANLDNQNGGFTVFARVTGPSMATADRIANLPRVNVGGSFTELPVSGWTSGSLVLRQHTVRITEVTEFPAAPSASDRIFNYLEAAYPQFLSPSKATTGQAMGYTFRYYGQSNSYVGTKDGQVWYLVPAISGEIRSLGSMTDWLAAAQAAGY